LKGEKNMNKFVKAALIFTSGVAGGFVLCGITTIKFVVKSDIFRTALKNKISKEVTTFLYGENDKPKKRYSSYRSYYENRKTEKPFENVVFETRKDAEDILSSADDICRTYGWITVSDLYNLCGLVGSFEDYSLGWSDLSTVKIMRTKHGYQIIFPKPLRNPLNWKF
jgi:hypothetical protein